MSLTQIKSHKKEKKKFPPIHVGEEVFVNIIIDKVINTTFGGVLQVCHSL
jgi:hypothetical protein